jgi:mediator of RNA polymerase II transcription subunit 14
MEAPKGGAHLSNGVAGGIPGLGLTASKGPERSESDAAVQNGDQPLANGDHAPGKPAAGGVMAALNGVVSEPPELDIPPEMLQAITASYMPLSLLFQRAAQECMNELDDTITKMADLNESSVEGANGSLSNGSRASAMGVSVAKKRALLEFANTQRERFIRILVVSQWTKKTGADMDKLIRLSQWLKLSWLHQVEETSDALFFLKTSLPWFKEPAPDIRTALEVLSTGKASWLPSVSTRV